MSLNINDEERNELLKRWQDNILKASEYTEDPDMHKEYMDKADKAYQQYNDVSNKRKAFNDMEDNANMAKYIYAIHDSYPELLRYHKDAIPKFINMLKNNKPLKKANDFISSLSKFRKNKNISSNDYVKECCEFINKGENFTKKQLNESLKEVSDFCQNYYIGIDPSLSKDSTFISVMENCNYLLTQKKNINNLQEYTKAINEVADYLKSTKDTFDDSKVDISKAIINFNNKVKNLNEDDKKTIHALLSGKSEEFINEKKEFFDTLKNECITKFKKYLLDESTSEQKETLKDLYESVEKISFNDETLIKDLAKFYNVMQILDE